MDTRTYVAKIKDNEPVFIAVKGTVMSGGNVAMRDIKELDFGDDQVYILKEVCYSKEKANSFTHENNKEVSLEGRSMMSGPDLFHLYDSKKNIRFNLWQPLHLDNQLELVIYKYPGDHEERQGRLLSFSGKQTSCRAIILSDKSNEDILNDVLFIWLSECGKHHPVRIQEPKFIVKLDDLFTNKTKI
jgi:hypothetical protein